MRGLFTAGVLDVFMEKGISFDGAVGISAGGIFGCNMKSHQIGRGLRYNQKYGRDPRYCSFRSLIKTGDLYGADFCYRELPYELDPFDFETFEKDPMEFYVGATDINTGRTVFHKCKEGKDEDMKWFRASASMPVVSKPVACGKYLLLDGGITDPIPLRFMEKKGYDRNVVILTQPAGYIKKKSPEILLVKLMLRDYPAVVRAMSRRHLKYNAQTKRIARLEEEGKIIVIRPPEDLKISRTENDPDELQRVYDIGRRTGACYADRVKLFLSDSGYKLPKIMKGSQRALTGCEADFAVKNVEQQKKPFDDRYAESVAKSESENSVDEMNL